MTEWQPISSAPKDGTDILLIEAWPEGGDGIYALACWGGKAWSEINGGSISHFDFTHWMPLPAAPQNTTGETK